MNKFKERWEIQKNWQLLFPILGLLGLFYAGYKIANAFLESFHIGFKIALALVITFLLTKICLFLFKKLENKWKVDHRWEIIRIFIVFSITGSSSVFIGRPFIKYLGITPDNLNVIVYWVLYLFLCLVFYQILLVCFGWLLGQHQFFWAFEKKMLRRFGLGRFLD